MSQLEVCFRRVIVMTAEKPLSQRDEKQGCKLGRSEDPCEDSSGKKGKELDAGKPVMEGHKA